MWVILKDISYNTDAFRSIWLDREGLCLHMLTESGEDEEMIAFASEETLCKAYRAIIYAIAQDYRTVEINEYNAGCRTELQVRYDMDDNETDAEAAGETGPLQFILFNSPIHKS